MVEPSDRLARPDDIAAIFAARRRLIRKNWIFVDELESSGTPGTRRNVDFGRKRFGTPRGGSGREMNGTPVSVRRENVLDGGSGRRGRGSSSVLPNWYPRTPLLDITHAVRAIERRRAFLGDDVCKQPLRPLPCASSFNDPSASISKYDPCRVTPMPLVASRRFTTGKVPRILLDITNQNKEESELLTPQKMLLNSIDTVEKGCDRRA